MNKAKISIKHDKKQNYENIFRMHAIKSSK